MRRYSFTDHDKRPIWLQPEEINDPQAFLRVFFAMHELPMCRFYLWELFTSAVHRTDGGSHIKFAPSDIVWFVENMMCLLEVADLLRQRQVVDFEGISPGPQNNASLLEPFMPPNEAGDTESPLAPIIQMIVKSMDAEKIFLLGSYPLHPSELGMEYDLLVLVKDTHNRPLDELESLIQNRSQDLPPVHATVYKLSKVNEMIGKGNYFFSTFCTEQRLIFNAGRTVLKTPPRQLSLPERNQLAEAHTAFLHKANGFLEGARHYYAQQEYPLAGFMLHQVVEHGLNALLTPLLQFRLQTHNLHKLMRFARRFSGAFCPIFPRDTEEEVKLFQLLQSAYIHARYKDNYKITGQEVVLLTEKVTLLLSTVREQFATIYREITHSTKE